MILILILDHSRRPPSRSTRRMDSPTDDKSNYFTMNPNQPLISSNRPVASPHSPVPVAPMVVPAPDTPESTSCCHFSNNFYLTAAFGFTLSIICVFQVRLAVKIGPFLVDFGIFWIIFGLHLGHFGLRWDYTFWDFGEF